MSNQEEEKVAAYLLRDAQWEYEGLRSAISSLGWKFYGDYPEGQNVPIECVVNVHQNGVIAKTLVTRGEYFDEESGPDYHPQLGSDMWGGIDVVLWRELRR